jgi:RNA polymerase sigma factor (sigma-70 family)
VTTPTDARPLGAKPPSTVARDSPDSDEGLVARLGRRDEDALRALHHRYAALAFTVAVRFVDAATAEEVVQDVFVTLWRKHGTFDPARGPFKSWIAQIAKNRALNELRRRQGRGPHTDEPLDELPDDSLEPDEAQWQAHRRMAIRAAVDALPAAQRQALSLAFFDELTHEQIASFLQTPVGTTKTRIRLALKRLAPVLVAALVTTAVVLLARRQEERDTRAARDERALRMVTASDVVPLRLRPVPGTTAEAHGSYRGRPGAGIEVLTTSRLPPLVAPKVYVAWAHRPNGWRSLGTVEIASDGRSLLVSEVAPGEAPPDDVLVTRESNSKGGGPVGPAVLEWSASDGAPK